jgi:hypothetical protein
MTQRLDGAEAVHVINLHEATKDTKIQDGRGRDFVIFVTSRFCL